MTLLIDRFRVMPPRERHVVTIVGGVLLLVLAISLWIPLQRTRDRLASGLPPLRASIANLERQAEEAKRLRAMPAVASPGAAPLTALGTGAASLQGTQVALIDAKTIAVTGSDVGFGPLLEWLASVQATQGLRVETARIERLPAPGRVRVELRLTRA